MEGLIFPNICLCVIFVHFNVLKMHLQHVSKSFTQIITIFFFKRKKHYKTKLLTVWSVNITHQPDKTNPA